MLLELAAAATISAGAFAMPTRAQSPIAQFIMQQADESHKHLRQSITFGANKIFEELAMAYSEFQVENWDGYGALPVSNDTLIVAEHFLKALPLGTKNPSIGAEPDGQLTLEWYHSPRKLLSISISAEGILHYAGLFGSSKSYGSEIFTGKVPESIMTLINRVPAA